MTCKNCEYNNRKKYSKTIVTCPKTQNLVLVTSKFCVEKCDAK